MRCPPAGPAPKWRLFAGRGGGGAAAGGGKKLVGQIVGLLVKLMAGWSNTWVIIGHGGACVGGACARRGFKFF